MDFGVRSIETQRLEQGSPHVQQMMIEEDQRVPREEADMAAEAQQLATLMREWQDRQSSI